jgi:hypothetical protein
MAGGQVGAWVTSVSVMLVEIGLTLQVSSAQSRRKEGPKRV